MEEIIEVVMAACERCQIENDSEPVYKFSEAIQNKNNVPMGQLCESCFEKDIYNEKIKGIYTYSRECDESDYVCLIELKGFQNKYAPSEQYIHSENILDILEERGYIWRI